jgi:hypothetical protein
MCATLGRDLEPIASRHPSPLTALRGPYRFKGTFPDDGPLRRRLVRGLSGVYEAATVIEVRAVLDCDPPDVGFRVAETEAVPPARPLGLRIQTGDIVKLAKLPVDANDFSSSSQWIVSVTPRNPSAPPPPNCRANLVSEKSPRTTPFAH